MTPQLSITFSVNQVLFLKCQNIVINPHCIFPEVTQYKNTPYSIKDDNKAKKSSNSGTSKCLVFLLHVVSGTSEMMKCGPESSKA